MADFASMQAFFSSAGSVAQVAIAYFLWKLDRRVLRLELLGEDQ